MRGTNEFADYNNYRRQKGLAANKHPVFARIYAMIWVTDYLLQVALQIVVPKMKGQCLIVDRYFYDTILNMALTANLSSKATYTIIDLLLRIFPNPDIVLLIDLPEETAFSRKKDIQSVAYLRERRHKYLSMADRYGFVKINGELAPEDILEQTIRILFAGMAGQRKWGRAALGC